MSGNYLIFAISLLSVFITYSHQESIRIQACNVNYTEIEYHTCLNITDCNEITYVLQAHFSLLKFSNPVKIINELDCNTTSIEVCCFNQLPMADECEFDLQYDHDTQFGDFPWDVQLFYDEMEKPICGGVLISKRFVLTTAYCAMGRKSEHKLKFLRLGEYDNSKPIDCENENEITCLNQILDIDFIEIVIHPNYSVTTRDNDIAMIRLPRDIEATEFIRPICIDMDPTKVDGYNMLGTGWSRNFRGIPNDVKFQLRFESTTPNVCNRRFHIEGRHDFVCAFATNSTTEYNCSPELGNSVVVKPTPKSVCLKGLISQCTSCMSQSRQLAVITLIDPHVEWIIKYVNNN